MAQTSKKKSDKKKEEARKIALAYEKRKKMESYINELSIIMETQLKGKASAQQKLKTGQRLRRTELDYLIDKGYTQDIALIVDAIYDVRNSKSTLPARIRTYLIHLHNTALINSSNDKQTENK